MKIYLIIEYDSLCESDYIKPIAYKDEKVANAKCKKLNDAAQKSKDMWKQCLSYTVHSVEVADES